MDLVLRARQVAFSALQSQLDAAEERLFGIVRRPVALATGNSQVYLPRARWQIKKGATRVSVTAEPPRWFRHQWRYED